MWLAHVRPQAVVQGYNAVLQPLMESLLNERDILELQVSQKKQDLSTELEQAEKTLYEYTKVSDPVRKLAPPSDDDMAMEIYVSKNNTCC